MEPSTTSPSPFAPASSSRASAEARRTAPASNVLTVGDVRLDVASAAVTRTAARCFSALEHPLLYFAACGKLRHP